MLNRTARRWEQCSWVAGVVFVIALLERIEHRPSRPQRKLGDSLFIGRSIFPVRCHQRVTSRVSALVHPGVEIL
jgi:hypothetical protein